MSHDPASPPSRRRRLLIPGLVVVTLAGLLVVAGFVVFGPDDTPTRQEVVAQRGSKVMPFDLNATQHHFETTATGAVETVTADSADVGPLLAAIPHDAVRACQAGLVADMDLVADVLYGRG